MDRYISCTCGTKSKSEKAALEKHECRYFLSLVEVRNYMTKLAYKDLPGASVLWQECNKALGDWPIEVYPKMDIQEILNDNAKMRKELNKYEGKE